MKGFHHFALATSAIPLLFLLAACSLLAPRPSLEFQTIARQQFAEPAGETLYADIYVPDGAGPFPAVVVIHGGGWVGGERSDMDWASQWLARHGLVVMNIDYRSAREYPHPAQLEDCRTAVRWLRQNARQYHVQQDAIGALGYSAGGHLALMLGVTRPDYKEKVSSRIGAVVSGAGPTNLLEYPDSGLVKRFTGGKRITGRGHIWADASPITHVSADDPPVMFYHGWLDFYVRPRQSWIMARALKQAEVPAEVDIQPFGHALTHVFSAGALSRAAAFLKRHLK